MAAQPCEEWQGQTLRRDGEAVSHFSCERCGWLFQDHAPIPSGAYPALQPEERTGSIDERFDRFQAQNPWVYDELLALARQMTGRGHRRLGIGMLWEVLRWNYFLTTADPSSEFKLNDHYRSRYARLIMEQEPDLAGVFELRKLRSLEDGEAA